MITRVHGHRDDARARRAARDAAAGTAALLVAVGCDAGVQAPPGAAPVTVAASVQSLPDTASRQTADALAEVFRKADRVRVRVVRRSDDNVLAERELPFEADEGGAELELEVELESDRVPARLEVVLARAGDPLFDGAEDVTLVAGETATVEMEISPVAAALEVREEPVRFEAIGDTVELDATLLFATGDTIPGAEARWSSGDPEVVEVQPDGTLISRGEGETEAIAAFQDLSASVRVTVDANDPPSATITSPEEGAEFQEGETIPFEGSAEDPEQGELTGGALEWFSDVDGQIGTGRSFTRSDLTPAVHEITLVATDERGAADSSEVQITVSAPGSIGGRVTTDPDGAPLSDVGVELLSAGESVDAATTDAGGRYRFAEVEPGDYTVRLETETLPELGEIEAAERSVSVGIDEDVGGVDFTFLRPLVTARTLLSSNSVSGGETTTVRLELVIRRVDRPVGGVTAELAWDGGVAAFVAESASFPGWDTGAANLQEAGLLRASAVSGRGVQPDADGVVPVVTYDVTAVATGETEIAPALREMELVDPDTGRTFDLLGAAVLETVPATLTVQ